MENGTLAFKSIDVCVFVRSSMLACVLLAYLSTYLFIHLFLGRD